MIQLKNILVPTDFSESSLAATRYALELAKAFDATIHLFHVIEDPTVYSAAFGGYIPDPTVFEQYAEERLANWILPEDAKDLRIEHRWTHGRTFVEIVRDAAKHDIDLIVIGTHGYGFTAHLLLGSVAEKVVRKAPCPVLTVRPEGYEFESITAKGES